MTLPASGQIALSCVNTELGLGSTTTIQMNQCTVRTLFGKASGQISMSDGYGKSNIVKGSAAYTSAGSYCWVAPAGVTSVSVVVIGGGSGTGCCWNGGGGGATAYKNNIAVTPGKSYSLTVGAGGNGKWNPYPCLASNGGFSAFASCTVRANGGNTNRTGGTVSAGTGGAGGNGGTYNEFFGGGGGGAGGYAGTGGYGGNGGNSGSAGPACSGGAGGGAGGRKLGNCYCCPTFCGTGAAGGGTGIYGGTTAGAGGYRGSAGYMGPSCPQYRPQGGGGGGGKCGYFGTTGTTSVCRKQPYLAITCRPNGGLYGGGAGNSGGGYAWGIGGRGAVRIIYPGCSRSFPNTCTVSP